MTNNTQLLNKLEELNELEEMIETLKLEAEAIKDNLKDTMTSMGKEEMVIGDYVVKYTSVLSSRFDTKRFKTTMGEDLYKAFTKEVPSMRFSISH